MNEVRLSEAIRSELQRLRATGRIPTEVHLSQDAWNTVRRQMTYGRFGSKMAVQFEGLPAVMVLGLKEDPGFAIRFIDPD